MSKLIGVWLDDSDLALLAQLEAALPRSEFAAGRHGGRSEALRYAIRATAASNAKRRKSPARQRR